MKFFGLLRIFLLAILVSFTALLSASEVDSTVSTLPSIDVPVPEIKIAPFAGALNHKLLLGGGEYSIDSSDSKAKTTKVSSSILILEEWKKDQYTWRTSRKELPIAAAGGTSLSSEKSLYWIGGKNETGTLSACWKIDWDDASNDVKISRLPDLPSPLVNVAGGVIGATLYLIGSPIDDRSGGVAPLFLSIELPEANTSHSKWRFEEPFPGVLRSPPLTAIQNGSFDKQLYLFESCNLWTYDPVGKQWREQSIGDSFPDQFTPSAVLASGSTHLLLTEENRSDPSDPDYQKRNRLLAFNTITHRLFLLSELSSEISSRGPVFHWNGKIVHPNSENVSEITGFMLPPERNRLGLLNMSVVIIYFSVLAGMGFFFSRRQKGTDDYFRAGNRVPWWALGISIYGTSLSAISYMTIPAKSFMSNWEMLFLLSAPLWAAPVLTRIYIPALRRHHLTSAYEYLEVRFCLAIRLFGSAIFIMFQIIRMAVMLFLPAIAINVVTGLDIYFCIIIVGSVSALYTIFGGIEAVIWTDVLQVIILMGGLILAIGVVFFRVDLSPVEVLHQGFVEGKFRLFDPSINFKATNFWTIMLASFFLYLIPFSSDQALVQRYFVSKTDREATQGLWVNAWITMPGAVLLFLLGSMLFLFYQNCPQELSVQLENNDSLLPWFVITQIPNGLSGLMIVAIFSAAMSSLSASINAISTAWTIDFHQRLFSAQGKSALFVARFVTLLAGLFGILLALVMATWDITSFWDEYNRLLGLMTSGLAGLFFLGLLTKRANTFGAVVGLIASAFVQSLIARNGSVHILLYSGTGFVSTIVIGYLASRLVSHQKEMEDTSKTI